jgi:alkylhydroperoxidase/carboxymuconolactone decarboxylase family protein YurZ
LDHDQINAAIAAAMAEGATPAQIQEIVSLVSGLGVHSLMATAVPIARAAGLEVSPFTPEQQALWDRHVGSDPFWNAFETEFPGFLGAMLRLSADQFTAFFDYCAVPWKSGQVRAKLKELIAMACDATPTHRFGPGFRLHLGNAIKLGAGGRAVTEALDIAAAAPMHVGWR